MHKMAKATQTKIETPFFNYLYIITWALMPIVFLLYQDKVQDAGLFPRVMLLAISLGIGGAFLFTKKTKPLPFRITLAAISFFVLWHFAGYSNAYSKSEFWITFARNTLMLGYLLFTFQLLRNNLLKFESIIKAVVIFSAIAAISVLGDLLSTLADGEYVTNIYKVTGMFVHKNFAASALLLCIPFLYLGTRLNKPWRNIAIATLCLVLIEIALLRTRGVWVGFFAGISATVLLQLLSKQKAAGQLKWVGIGTGIFIAILSLVFLVGNNQEKILNKANIDLRIKYWNSSIEMAKENPVLGVGAGNWKTNFPKYGLAGTNKSVMEGETNISRPHNDMLWILAEMGVPAWIAIAAFQLFLLFICVKLLNHVDGEKRNYAMAAIFALVAFAGYGLGEFPLERPIAVGLLVLFAAEALRLGEEENILKRPLFTMSGKAVAGSVLALSVIVLIIGNGRMKGEKNAKLAVNAYATKNPPGMLKYGEAAKNTFFEIDIYNSPMQYFTGMGYAAQQNLKKSEQEYRDGLLITPYSINTLLALGDVLKYQKRFDEAIEVYNKSLAISPRFYRANLNKAEIYLYQKNTIEAIKSVNAVSYDITYPKHKQIAIEVLNRLAKMPDQTRFKKLQAMARQHTGNNEQIWINYIAWKTNARAVK